ncbi:hypothetical protein [Romboutsia sp.]|uniref:hypothetical protein n=1 Tax=Romboutsia sp. TaxID=1965302 RepID=UPI002C4A796F|nr:hypothetical protein [Romboutsia sp.]HSQ88317.1 hypothetical protein [Romboutsia sp.]
MVKMISDSFIYDLKEGALSKILKYVKADSTLQMELRKNGINIYYRGGSLIKIKENEANDYTAYFDKNYITTDDSESVMIQCIDGINTVEKTKKLIEFIPKIKQQMDFWMTVKKPNGGEREYQHIVAKENNLGNVGKYSDYFICDIEYDGHLNKDENYKFDMIGVKWPSNSEARKNNNNLNLCIIGMKYGEKSDLKILSYMQDIYKFLSYKDKLNNLKEEMKEIYKVKSELGLIYPYEGVDIDFSNKVEVIFIFANQNPKQSSLKEEINEIKEKEIYGILSQIADIKVAKSSFVGYGLYEENIISI